MYIVEYWGYHIKPHPEHPKSFICIFPHKGGRVPVRLSGMFTSVGQIKREIDAYLNVPKNKKETKDDEGIKQG